MGYKAEKGLRYAQLRVPAPERGLGWDVCIIENPHEISRTRDIQKLVSPCRRVHYITAHTYTPDNHLGHFNPTTTARNEEVREAEGRPSFSGETR